jgi:hypothetical protein
MLEPRFMHKFVLVLLISFIALLSACKPACPIQSCHIRKVHLHGKKQFRGQPLWKKQNPRIGEKMGRKNPQDNQESRRKERKNKK